MRRGDRRQDTRRTSEISEEIEMNTRIQNIAKTFGLLLAGALLTATAFAQCPGGAVPKAKLHRQAWEPGGKFGAAD